MEKGARDFDRAESSLSRLFDTVIAGCNESLSASAMDDMAKWETKDGRVGGLEIQSCSSRRVVVPSALLAVRRATTENDKTDETDMTNNKSKLGWRRRIMVSDGSAADGTECDGGTERKMSGDWMQSRSGF